MKGGDFFVGNSLVRKFLAYMAFRVYNVVDTRSLRRRFTVGREFELKFSATPQQQAALASRFGDFSVITMETTYYDTPDRTLSDRRITLRRRLENGHSICTLKTPTQGYGRGEWEVEREEISQAVDELCQLSGWEGLPELLASGIEPVCGACFTRLAKTIVLEGCTVELALDSGILLGGGKQIPLCEVEVELKSGSEDAAVDFAKALSREFGLKQEKKSKFRRALALARGE